jgi:hypothetical protein
VPVRIVTDAVGFCRLVASRASPADLDLDIAGDPARATGVLAAAATLALDGAPGPGDPPPLPVRHPSWKRRAVGAIHHRSGWATALS